MIVCDDAKYLDIYIYDRWWCCKYRKAKHQRDDGEDPRIPEGVLCTNTGPCVTPRHSFPTRLLLQQAQHPHLNAKRLSYYQITCLKQTFAPTVLSPCKPWSLPKNRSPGLFLHTRLQRLPDTDYTSNLGLDNICFFTSMGVVILQIKSTSVEVDPWH